MGRMPGASQDVEAILMHGIATVMESATENKPPERQNRKC